ncbi:unnamed protein product [Phaedon cochleariae]|uniref:Uncharacterized protein n=1 Tax=Phaedon cochleariae TaxID=80249 RepID=A0A9N9SEN7_PHACE|nr:unnamed protein product [Phaedon cochleariae]
MATAQEAPDRAGAQARLEGLLGVLEGHHAALLPLRLARGQVELENWVNSIHSACAAAFARHRGKTGTLHLLQEEIFRLEKSIETVS